MVYDVRSFDLIPHTVGEAERRLADACAASIDDGELVGTFHTEIGPLNRVLQIWASDETTAERVSRAVAAARAVLDDLVEREQASLVTPFAFAPTVGRGAVGPFFEVRTYRFATGELPKIEGAWEIALPDRLAFGPLVLAGHTEGEAESLLVHVWPYRSLDDRERIRREARAAGAWPPRDVALSRGLPVFEVLQMENAIYMPAAFSPLQ